VGGHTLARDIDARGERREETGEEREETGERV
jgi:hypothetical protein